MLLCPLVKPDVSINMATGEISLFLGKGASFDPTPISPDVFALPGELTKAREFAWRYALMSFSRFPNSTGARSKMPYGIRFRSKGRWVCFCGISALVDGGNAFRKTPFYKDGPQMLRDRYRQRLEGLYCSPFSQAGQDA
jgi:hypothetical protein